MKNCIRDDRRLSEKRARATRFMICAALSFGVSLIACAGIAGTALIHLNNFATVNYAVGSFPISVTVADFNNDAKLDLAVANYNSDNVSVLLGNGDGTFQAAANYADICFGPSSVASGDFNFDNKLDLVTVDNRCSNGNVFLGNGNGTFQNATGYGAMFCPQAAITGDFNRDGRVDIASVNGGGGCLAGPIKGDPKAVTLSASNSISVSISNGNGTFQSPVDYPVGSNPSEAVSGDFNRDFILDLAVTSGGTDSVSILIGNGNGTFHSAINYPAGVRPHKITRADFNLDSKPDLAVAHINSNIVSVLLGNANGTFQAPLNYTAGPRPGSVAAGDFNGDLKRDIVTANTDGNSVSVLYGNGDGTFQPAVNYPVGSSPNSVASGDFNSDGKLDLVVANGFGSNVSVLLNCTGLMAVSPASQFFMANGGADSVNVSGPGGCGWAAVSNDSWIVITSSSNGTGSEPVEYEVRENFTGSARQGSLIIGGNTFTVIQDGGLGEDCSYSISPASQSVAPVGGSGSINVTSEVRCAWQAVSNVAWISITSGDNGIGNGTVNYSVAANSSVAGRKGTVSVAGQVFSIKQKGN